MTIARSGLGLMLLTALFGCASPPASAPANAPDIALFVGAALPSYQLTVADPENRQRVGPGVTLVPKLADTRFPNSRTSATLENKDGANDAVTLAWRDIWYAGLRVDGGAPLDLTPYVARGTLEFDLKVNDLAKGGLAFRLGCGPDCERKVAYVAPGRAAVGKGWQRVALAMSCFARDADNFGAIDQPFALEGTGSGEVSIANIVMRASGTPNTPCPDYKTVSVTPEMLNESWSIDWWLPRHQAKLDEVRAMKAKGINPELVFIGDSITHSWEKEGAKVWARNYARYNALDLGFSGDRTENVLWRLQHGAVDGIAPKVAVLMFGTNNTGHRLEDPATTAAGIRRNLDELRQRLPNTRILLLAIFPREATANGKLRQINEQVNTLIARYADKRKVFFVNLNPAFLQPDGTLSTDIMPDLLHPNERGYEIWADAMRPHLDRLLQP